MFQESWEDIVRGKIDLKGHLDSVFKEKIFQEIGILPDHYVSYWLQKDRNIDFDMLGLVKNLKIPCYLGTNQEALRAHHIVQLIGECFKGCFASYEIGYLKPEPQFFHHISEKLSLRSNELLLIDDKKENTEGAKECGWNVYHYRHDLEALKSFIAAQIEGFNT